MIIKQGTQFTREITISDSNWPIDLTGRLVEFVVGTPNKQVFKKECTIVDAEDGTAELTLSLEDTATCWNYQFQIILTTDTEILKTETSAFIISDSINDTSWV
jgi:hypothetical protein